MSPRAIRRADVLWGPFAELAQARTTIPALVERSGGPVAPSRAALASLFGTIDWHAVGHETTQHLFLAIFLAVVRPFDSSPDASHELASRRRATRLLDAIRFLVATAPRWVPERAAVPERADRRAR